MAKKTPMKTRKATRTIAPPKAVRPADAAIRAKLEELRAEPLTASSTEWIAALIWCLHQLENERA
jgi:hypothetical protein